MNSLATSLATLATCSGTLLLLLIFAPSLQAPFLVPKFAVLELMASLGLVAFALARATTGRPRWPRPLMAGALLVFLTTALSWAVAEGRPLGAPYATDAMVRWGSLFGVACGTSVLDNTEGKQQRVLDAVTIAAGVVAALGFLQHLDVVSIPIPVISTPGSTFGNRNIAAEVIAMALPMGMSVLARSHRWQARAAAFFALLLIAVYLAFTRARGAWLGALFGLGTTLWLGRLRWSRESRLLAVALVVAAVIGVAVPGRMNSRDAGDRKRYSGVVELLQDGIDSRSTAVKTRFGLWRRTLPMIRQRPLLGIGPGNWPIVFPLHAEPGAARDGVLTATLAPRQAHNDFLERAAETGIVGLLALGSLVAGVVISVRRNLRSDDESTRVTTASAAGALAALVVMSVASFPLDMPGTIALTGLALGLVASGSTERAHEVRGREARLLAFLSIAAAMALVGCAALRAVRTVRASRWLEVAERGMHRDRGKGGAEGALAAVQLALQSSPDDYRARLRLAQALLRDGRPQESVHAAESALAVEPYAPNAWAALAAAKLDANDPAGARHDATRALELLHEFPFALRTRFESAQRLGDDAAALDDRQRLTALAAGADDDPTVRAARALLVPSPN